MDQNEPVSPSTGPAEPPRGIFRAKLDDKGRLKLPAAFHQFFRGLGDPKVFVTSLDRRIAQIYPIALWKQNEAFFESYTEDPGAAEVVLFNANDLGADAEIDAQGRLSFNSDLRRVLGLDAGDLHLLATKGRVEILTSAIYQERQAKAQAMAADALTTLRKGGLK